MVNNWVVPWWTKAAIWFIFWIKFCTNFFFEMFTQTQPRVLRKKQYRFLIINSSIRLSLPCNPHYITLYHFRLLIVKCKLPRGFWQFSAPVKVSVNFGALIGWLLNLSCIMSQNGWTHFKNPPANATRF